MAVKKNDPLIGAHMSTSGGAHKAIEIADAVDCTALQIFTKNNNQWRAKPLTDDDVEKFFNARKASPIRAYVGHVGYLINVASPKDEIYKKSVDSLTEEIERGDRLGLSDVVMHPGAHLKEGEEYAIKKIADSLNRIIDLTPDITTRFALETTAGQGTNVGYKFEQIAAMIDLVENKARLSVCFDTCHTFAAGYELRTKKDWDATFKAFDDTIGLDYLKVFHVNDSKREFGSRVDRHEQLGQGELGLEPFKFLMQDKRFVDVPKILETPKLDDQEGNDRRNLDILRSFVK
ncbi:MAG: deoxyribonuclease IV [Candidatus Zixiibacteriota bacterium]